MDVSIGEKVVNFCNDFPLIDQIISSTDDIRKSPSRGDDLQILSVDSRSNLRGGVFNFQDGFPLINPSDSDISKFVNLRLMKTISVL